MATDQISQGLPPSPADHIDLAAAWRASLSSPPLPQIARSVDAFRRDLPDLLSSHAGQWVAYSGDEQVGFARTRRKVCAKCFRRGLTRNDFIAVLVEPGALQPDEEIEVTHGEI